MALTKMIARIVANQRRQPAGAVTATNKPGPSNQRRRRLSRQRIRAKNIAGRIRGLMMIIGVYAHTTATTDSSLWEVFSYRPAAVAYLKYMTSYNVLIG